MRRSIPLLYLRGVSIFSSKSQQEDEYLNFIWKLHNYVFLNSPIMHIKTYSYFWIGCLVYYIFQNFVSLRDHGIFYLAITALLICVNTTLNKLDLMWHVLKKISHCIFWLQLLLGTTCHNSNSFYEIYSSVQEKQLLDDRGRVLKFRASNS